MQPSAIAISGWLMCRCDALAEFQETVHNSSAQAKACDFLISKQCKDGGWAESYLSSQTKVHITSCSSATVPSSSWPTKVQIAQASLTVRSTAELDAPSLLCTQTLPFSREHRCPASRSDQGRQQLHRKLLTPLVVLRQVPACTRGKHTEV